MGRGLAGGVRGRWPAFGAAARGPGARRARGARGPPGARGLAGPPGPRPPGAASGGLDRRGDWRGLPEAEVRGRPGAALLALRGGQALLERRGGGAGAAGRLGLAAVPLASVEAAPPAAGLAGPLVLLGASWAAGAGAPPPLFAAEVGPDFEPEQGGAEFEWHKARAAYGDLGDLAPAEVEALALGHGLNEWHRRTKFCSRCGQPVLPGGNGHYVRCAACGARDYPRTDPCAIVLMYCGDWALLGRKAAWPPGRYSTLAGFTEMAESLEASALREVLEESGVRGDPAGLRFLKTQPWPFPRSLMAAFEARAPPATPDAEAEAEVEALDQAGVPACAREPALQACAPCEEELEDVRWFHRRWLNAAMGGGAGAAGARVESAAREVAPGVPFRFPGPGSVSRELMDGWRAAAPPAAPLDALPDAVLCPGRQKYVLVLVEDPASGTGKLVVRGLAAAEYHMDVFQHFFGGDAQLDLPAGLRARAVGGGRIEHDQARARVRVFGFSYQYGRAPHSAAAKALRKEFPFLAVETSNEGY